MSEQIATREDAFEQFQKLSIAQQSREKHLWKDEAREELENTLFGISEAQRQLAEERAITAQLRLVLQEAKNGRLDVLQSLEIPGDETRDAGDTSTDNSVVEKKDADHDGQAKPDDARDDVLFSSSQSPASTRRNTSFFTGAQTLHDLRTAGALQALAAGYENETQKVAAQVLFDKAAADSALTKALQEENTALRRHIEVKESRNLTLHAQVQDLQSRLTQTEAAISELLESAAPT